MGYLLSRIFGRSFLKLYFVWSVFNNFDCNKCGQTSRLVAGAQIQTTCNFEKNMYNCFWVLSIVGSSSIFWNPHILPWCQYIITALCLVTTIFAYTKISYTLRHNQIHLQSHVPQGQPSQVIPALNIARYRKAVYIALWVQGTLIICYLPSGIEEALQLQRGMTLSIYLAQQFTATLVYLNSSLNPLLYCWRIREVRQAVKETLRQMFSCSS